MTTMSGGEDAFSILFVCTANRFRSPLAASTLTRELESLPVRVSSRGVLDVGRMPPLTRAIVEAQRWDLDVTRHRAQRLGPDDIGDMDLLVGFEQAHLAAAMALGAPSDGVFALEEIVVLIERIGLAPSAGDYAQSVRAIIAAANDLRDPTAEITPIEDPVGLPPREAAAIAGRVHLLTRRLARALTP
jgi:protein-tyrosine-phosphatase